MPLPWIRCCCVSRLSSFRPRYYNENEVEVLFALVPPLSLNALQRDSRANMAERRPRSKSARARLSTTKMEFEGSLESCADYARSKRAKSALSNRTKAESSRCVLPKAVESEEFEQTHYTSHFEGKPGDLPEVRPSSPTRRNNPHPAEVIVGH